MKFLFITLIACSYYPLFVSAASPPGPQTVNQLVSIAMNVDRDELKGAGPVQCQFVNDKPDLIAYGEDISKATNRLALLCIKDRCSNISNYLLRGHKILNQLNDSQLSSLMRSWGYEKAEIERAITNRSNKSPSTAKTKTCLNGTFLQKQFAVDFCYAAPMKCLKQEEQ